MVDPPAEKGVCIKDRSGGCWGHMPIKDTVLQEERCDGYDVWGRDCVGLNWGAANARRTAGVLVRSRGWEVSAWAGTGGSVNTDTYTQIIKMKITTHILYGSVDQDHMCPHRILWATLRIIYNALLSSYYVLVIELTAWLSLTTTAWGKPCTFYHSISRAVNLLKCESHKNPVCSVHQELLSPTL